MRCRCVVVSKRLLVLVACVGVFLSSDSSNARACECPDTPSAFVLWPRPDAVDVAIDTPLVIATHNASTPVDAVRLAGGDGDEVRVSEVLRLPASWKGCGTAERLFVRPVGPLRAGTRYTVSITSLMPTQQTHASSFTVGDQAFAAESPIRAEVHYLSNSLDSACTAHCAGVASMRIDIGRAPLLPRFLVVDSAASEHSKNEWTFWPDGFDSNVDSNSRHVAQLGVGLPPDDDCVNIHVYGLEGNPLFEEQRCTPDRCVVGGDWAGSTCGAPWQAAVDISRIPADSCEHPFVIKKTHGTIVYPDSDAGIYLSDEPSGCNVTFGEAHSCYAWVSAACALLLRMRKRRVMRI